MEDVHILIDGCLELLWRDGRVRKEEIVKISDKGTCWSARYQITDTCINQHTKDDVHQRQSLSLLVYINMRV